MYAAGTQAGQQYQDLQVCCVCEVGQGGSTVPGSTGMLWVCVCVFVCVCVCVLETCKGFSTVIGGNT